MCVLSFTSGIRAFTFPLYIWEKSRSLFADGSIGQAKIETVSVDLGALPVSHFTKDRYSISAVGQDCAKKSKRELLAVAGIVGGGAARSVQASFLWPPLRRCFQTKRWRAKTTIDSLAANAAKTTVMAASSLQRHSRARIATQIMGSTASPLPRACAAEPGQADAALWFILWLLLLFTVDTPF
jgi:hypothetical protein